MISVHPIGVQEVRRFWYSIPDIPSEFRDKLTISSLRIMIRNGYEKGCGTCRTLQTVV